jgi:hypothetical protein
MHIPITPSMLVAAEKCMMQIHWFHIEKLKLPPGIAREYGHVVEDQILNLDQASRLRGAGYLPVETLVEGVVTEMQKKVNDFDANDEDIQLYGGVEQAVGSYIDSGVLAMMKYNENRDLFSGGRSVNDIQYRFDVPIADTRLSGRMDLRASDNHVKDIKTRNLVKKGQRRTQQPEVDYDAQFSSYAYAMSVETGNPNQLVEALKIYRLPNQSEIVPMQTQKKEEAYDVLEEKAYRLHKIIQAGAFYPVNPTSTNGWVCQAKFCGAWTAGHNRKDGFQGCPFGERQQIAVGGFQRKEKELKK